MNNRFRVIFILIVLVYCISYSTVTIKPKAVFIDHPKKSETIFIKNNFDYNIEVSFEIEYSYITNDSEGKIVVNKMETDYYSLVPYIKIFPQRILLEPGESQSARIFVNFLNPKDGEYWARIIVQPKPIYDIKAPAVGMQMLTYASIPINFRVGKLFTGLELVKIENLKIDKNKLKVDITFRRVGSASYWGTLKFNVLDKSGKVLGNFSRPSSIFKTLRMPIEIPIQPGDIESIEIICESIREDVPKEKLIFSEKKRWVHKISR